VLARRQDGQRQSSPAFGIGRRTVSFAHQQCPDRLQVKAVPQRAHLSVRAAGGVESGDGAVIAVAGSRHPPWRSRETK